jgi:ABC-type transporter Mla maintaining outer membrane lipid asymmetry ATPase subunit MlaF
MQTTKCHYHQRAILPISMLQTSLSLANTSKSFLATNRKRRDKFDALVANLTGRKNVALYAAIKGAPRDAVKETVVSKLMKVGLSECDSDCLSTGYSRGISKQAVSERGRQ